MLSSGSAQTLGDGIYLWHHSKKLEHLCDESHCREKQHFQTDELLRSMSVVELHPISQSLLSVPLLQINWNSPDLHYLLQHSMFLKTWSYLLSPISAQAHLCLSLRPSCQQLGAERCLLLLYQSCLMLANDFKRYEGTGVNREGKELDRCLASKSPASWGNQAQSFTILSQKQNSLTLWTRVR